MWGGRFSDKPDALMQAINVSIGFDRRLAPHDLAGSRAHAAMLLKQGVISSDDEAQILDHIAQGLDNAQIAARLDLSEKTVRNHITSVFDKIGVESRAQAIVLARERGLGQRSRSS